MTTTSVPWAEYLDATSVPEGARGEYRVVHERAGPRDPIQLNSPRNAILGGQRGPMAISYPHETTWRRLEGPTGVWMTDLPVEQRQMRELLAPMRGRVLVGGLGLGLAAGILLRNPAVESVTVIEISREVIDLVWPSVRAASPPRRRKSVVCADLGEFLRAVPGKAGWRLPFDWAFYDTWQGDGLNTWLRDVVPLRAVPTGVVCRARCWNEDVMRGQVVDELVGPLASMNRASLRQPATDVLRAVERSDWHAWALPFWRSQVEAPASTPVALATLARWYADNYGRPGWEAEFASEARGAAR